MGTPAIALEGIEPLSREDLETRIKSATPESARDLLLSQAQVSDVPFLLFPKNSAIDQARLRVLQELYPSEPEFGKKSQIHLAAKDYHAATSEEERQGSVQMMADAMIEGASGQPIQDTDRDFYVHATRLMLDAFAGQKMKLKPHYVAEHSAHAVQILAQQEGVTLEHIITAMFHDFIEDACLEGPYSSEILAGKTHKELSIREEKQAIKVSGKFLHDRLCSDKFSDYGERMIPVIMAIDRLTRRSFTDYPTSMESIGEDQEEAVKMDEKACAYALSVKLCEKTSGTLTLGFATAGQIVKTLAKDIQILSPAGEYLSKHPDHEDAKLLANCIGVLGRAVYTVAEQQFDLVSQLAARNPRNRRKSRFTFGEGGRTAKINRLIMDGYLDRQERPRELHPIARESMGQIGYIGALLGAKWEIPSSDIHPMLKIPGENDEHLRRRLERDRQIAENMLPDYVISTDSLRQQRTPLQKLYHDISTTRGKAKIKNEARADHALKQLSTYAELLTIYGRLGLKSALKPQHSIYVREAA